MSSNHYTTLDIQPTASQAEIKDAYRRLAKQYHPDSNREVANHDRIAQVNAAYEVLGDPQQRQAYDRQLRRASSSREQYSAKNSRSNPQPQRPNGREADELLYEWLQRVYNPVNRLLQQVIKPLQSEIDSLAADPFDDDLLADFQAYLEDCRDILVRAQAMFRSLPNPASVAGVAANLYYCINQVSDGIDELERFTTSYDDHYLHTGQELFRIANGLRREAQTAMKRVAWGERSMAISKRYRRKVVVNDRCFLWFAKDDLAWIDVGCRFALSIISEDKHFNIQYGLGQLDAYRHLVSLGTEFPKFGILKRGEIRKGWQRVRCPRWEKDGSITPAIVRQIIEWSFTCDPDAIEVDWLGKDLTASKSLRQTLTDEEISKSFDSH
ncbi:MAG: J domain-containing protein [Microcoleus sp. SIO2G3]|nr:J domain-containing protein [Microcoleus sp. SIO2G3]